MLDLNNKYVQAAFNFFEKPESKTNYMIKHGAKMFCNIFLLILLLTFVLSCRKFEGNISVPSYLQIDSLSIYTDYPVQGSKSHKITTVWIYVDDELVGIYELPTKAPILAEGLHKVRLDAGINMDGIKAYRIYYPFYEAIIQEVDFVPEKVINLNADTLFIGNSATPYISSTTYWDNTEFVWMVDFEDPSYNLDSISPSKTNIERTPKDYPEAFLSPDSRYSGVVYLTSEVSYFKISSNVNSGEGFELQRLGNIPIFLEFDFKCNNLFVMGLFANGYSSVETMPIIIMNETSEWKKIYVNLKPAVDASVDAVDFNIYFEGAHKAGLDTTWVFLDNIKLVTR